MFFFLKIFNYVHIHKWVYIASNILLLVIIVHSGKVGLREKKLTVVKNEIIYQFIKEE